MAEQSKSRTALTVIVVLATILLVWFLVREMASYTKPAPVGAERAAARAKDNTDIRAAGENGLATYGYVDQAKGVVRIPIAEAMKMTVQGYRNAGQFRTDLLARVEKATAAAPKPPEKPNEYE
jgi:hypothetical protein